ncbi:MAG: type II secretion system secretin GspD [Deltaproteobacteria bacterium]|nr:type II secretion system secretin GspD [Deltaproteobacteria bacterium]
MRKLLGYGILTLVLMSFSEGFSAEGPDQSLEPPSPGPSIAIPETTVATPPVEPLKEPEPVPVPQPSNEQKPVEPPKGGPATKAPLPKDAKISIDFKDIEIRDLVRTISELTGQNFLVDDKVRGKITIISPTPVTPEEAYEVFLSVLAVNDLTVVKVGKINKIIPAREAKETPIETIVNAKTSIKPQDKYVTRLIPLYYIDAGTIVDALKGLISKYGNLQAYEPTNTLILTDTASNIDRLLRIISRLDTDVYSERIEVITLKYASAKTISSLISSLYTAKTGRGKPKEGSPTVEKILSDDRTNSVIIVANQPDLEAIKELIAKLDIEVPAGTGQIHVHYLQNADADGVASTLSNLTQGAGQPRQPGQTAAVAEFVGGIKITADKSTNSLVIVADPQDYETLKAVIDKLDIRRRQVFVEAAVVEISVDKLRDIGLSFHGGNAASDGGIITGGSNLGPVSTLGLDPTSLAGLSGLVLTGFGDNITVTDSSGNEVQVPAFGALLRLIQTDRDVNLLSTPHLLTTDNEEAEIVVGSNVPFQTGTSQSPTSTVVTIQRQDVGLTLRLKPQINEGDFVKLNIFQEVTSVIESPPGVDAATVGVTTSKRSAKTVVVVKDRQTVVIGGLITDNLRNAESKIPILGDIPILGWLFRSRSHRVEKTNLLIFLTPYVVKGPEDMDDIKRVKESEKKLFMEHVGARKPNRSYIENREEFTPPKEATPSSYTITPSKSTSEEKREKRPSSKYEIEWSEEEMKEKQTPTEPLMEPPTESKEEPVVPKETSSPSQEIPAQEMPEIQKPVEIPPTPSTEESTPFVAPEGEVQPSAIEEGR